MDLISRLSNFNNKVGTWVRDHWHIAQANAPIVNPVYSLGPAVILSGYTLPLFFHIPMVVALIVLYAWMLRHEVTREKESVWAAMEATRQYDPELYRDDEG